MTECKHEWGDVTSICKKCGLVLGKKAIERTVLSAVKKELRREIVAGKEMADASYVRNHSLQDAGYVIACDSILKDIEHIFKKHGAIP